LKGRGGSEAEQKPSVGRTKQRTYSAKEGGKECALMQGGKKVLREARKVKYETLPFHGKGKM